MPLVGADTSFLLPALLSPQDRRRKMLVLFAYAGLTYYARAGIDEVEPLEDEFGLTGIEHATASIEAFVTQAADLRAILSDQLPVTAPNDLVLVGSRPLFDEVERKLVSVGPRLARDEWTEESVRTYRGVLEAVCGFVVPDFEPAKIPRHTEGRDRDDDAIIETSLRAGAVALVSDDRKHIALSNDSGTVYRDPLSGHEVEAFLPGLFIELFVNTSNFNVDDVDGGLLETALGARAMR